MLILYQKYIYLHAIFKKMRNFFLLLFMFLSSHAFVAQIHEVGLFAGGSNFTGDVGQTTFIAPNEAAFGILYKWNKSPRHAWRVSYMRSNIAGQDIYADSQLRIDRRYAFTNKIKELSVGMEFNFFDFNLHESGTKITPYVYTGLSAMGYSELYWVGGKFKEDDYKYTAAIPMIVGVKARVAEHWVLGAEIGARYTFTDNIDGSNPKNNNLSSLKFGNINSNDWVVFSGITFTYTFGRKPCYCNY